MQDVRKAVWSISYVSVTFFPSLKQNFIAYHSSKVSSRPDCIFEIHQLWQSGFSRVYSNWCCSCSFEAEIIKIGQSSHKMYSNNIVNCQESTTILNACTKKSGILLNAPLICISHPVGNGLQSYWYQFSPNLDFNNQSDPIHFQCLVSSHLHPKRSRSFSLLLMTSVSIKIWRLTPNFTHLNFKNVYSKFYRFPTGCHDWEVLTPGFKSAVDLASLSVDSLNDDFLQNSIDKTILPGFPLLSVKKKQYIFSCFLSHQEIKKNILDLFL